MAFKFIPHIAVQVTNAKKAIDYYSRVLGMEVVDSGSRETKLRSNNMSFYVEEDPRGLVFFALEVEDLAEAKRILSAEGCDIYDETDRGFMARDAYGLRYYVSLPDT
jgi:catechol 2,3-dioxygenase-like lactoylglutathione lyase family enzyme